MKSKTQLKEISPAKPYEFVRLYLDIKQCRYIHALLSEKLEEIGTKGLEDINNALQVLTERFKNHAYPSDSKPFHKNESFDVYMDNSDPDEINMLLNEIYVKGALHVE
jgi:hypothetical protein